MKNKLKIAIAYKGAYKISHIRNGYPIDDIFLKEVTDTISNHKCFFDDLFYSEEIDYFFSTYNTSSKLDDLYLEKYNPKCFSKLDENLINQTIGWNAQLLHYKNLLHIIKQANKEYDLFLFTRLDIMFKRKINCDEIDLDKFNIVMKHLSGNCDDNLWILNRKHLTQFEQSIDSLIQKKQITHTINHELGSLNVPIHYIEDYNTKYNEGHSIFTFIR